MPTLRTKQHLTVLIAVAALLASSSPARAQSLRLSGGIEVGTLYDSNLEHRAEAAGAMGVLVAGNVKLRGVGRRAGVELGYGLGEHRYEARPDRNRTTHSVRGAFTLTPTQRVSLALIGDAVIGGMSEDREIGTEYSFTPRLELNLNARNRVRVRGLYRIRQFGERSGRDATNRGAGFDYRVGGSRQPRLEIGTRYDVTSTVDPRSRSRRWTHGVTFTAPIGQRLELGLGASQITRTYPERLVELEEIATLDLAEDERRILDYYVPDSNQPGSAIPLAEIPPDLLLRWRNLPRRDEIWSPSVGLTVHANKTLQLRVTYDLEVRLSNDLRKGYSGHTVELRSIVKL